MELSDETSRSESSVSLGGGGGSLSGTAVKAGDFLEKNTRCHLGASSKKHQMSPWGRQEAGEVFDLRAYLLGCRGMPGRKWGGKTSISNLMGNGSPLKALGGCEMKKSEVTAWRCSLGPRVLTLGSRCNLICMEGDPIHLGASNPLGAKVAGVTSKSH